MSNYVFSHQLEEKRKKRKKEGLSTEIEEDDPEKVAGIAASISLTTIFQWFEVVLPFVDERLARDHLLSGPQVTVKFL